MCLLSLFTGLPPSLKHIALVFLKGHHIIIFIPFSLHLIEFLSFTCIFVMLSQIGNSEKDRLGFSFHGLPSLASEWIRKQIASTLW